MVAKQRAQTTLKNIMVLGKVKDVEILLMGKGKADLVGEGRNGTLLYTLGIAVPVREGGQDSDEVGYHTVRLRANSMAPFHSTVNFCRSATHLQLLAFASIPMVIEDSTISEDLTQ
jgi:UDP-N-acetylenolpyruvoylglucosamine reductase